MRKPMVYVAGPYRKPDPVSNTHNAIFVGQMLRDAYDVVDVVPHLSMFEHLVRPYLDEQYWLDVTLDRMRCCDAVYRLSGYSTGSDAEVAEAERMGIPVFLEGDLDQLRDWAEKWKAERA